MSLFSMSLNVFALLPQLSKTRENNIFSDALSIIKNLPSWL